MKWILVICLFFFTFQPVQGQDLEALKKRLQTEADRRKIELYLAISELSIPQDTVLYYLNKALFVTKKIQFDSIYPLQFAKSASYFMDGDFEKAKREIRKGFNSYKWTDYPNATLGHINMLLGAFNEN